MDLDKTRDNVLAIECGVGWGSVALLSNKSVIASTAGSDCRPSRAEHILQTIHYVLEKVSVPISQIGTIAVSTGPGSYSGIRIGVSTAVGLANALDVLCVGVSVLDAMSHSANCDGNLIIAIPVGKTQVAWQSFNTVHDGGRDAFSSPQLTSEVGFISELTQFPDSTLFLHADLVNRLKTALPENIHLANAGTDLAEYVGVYAMIQAQTKSGSLQPIYLRDRNLISNSAST